MHACGLAVESQQMSVHLEDAKLCIALGVSTFPAFCKVCQVDCSLKTMTTLLPRMYIQRKLCKLQDDAECVRRTCIDLEVLGGQVVEDLQQVRVAAVVACSQP